MSSDSHGGKRDAGLIPSVLAKSQGLSKQYQLNPNFQALLVTLYVI